jgi:hypothetical protein
VRATCFALAAFVSFETAGCGLDDSAQVSCRCTDETNRTDFPDCVTGARPTPNNPFTTQLPDCPSGQLLILAEPTRPEFVLENLRTVFEARPQTRNLNQYMDQLAEHFTFVPDAEDIALHPEVFDTRRDTLWNRDRERRFARVILDPLVVQTVRFRRWYQSSKDERIISVDGLRQSYVFPYKVDFDRVPNESGTTEMFTIEGRAQISCVTPTLQNPVWTVEEWVDVRDSESTHRSWGEIRAEFFR